MKRYKIIFIFIIVFVVVFLSILFNQYFLFLPIVCFIPFSCGFSRRTERNYPYQSNQLPQSRELLKKCPFCEKEILEKNLRFCPNCGIKLV